MTSRLRPLALSFLVSCLVACGDESDPSPADAGAEAGPEFATLCQPLATADGVAPDAGPCPVPDLK
jgi:hypothetical protein